MTLDMGNTDKLNVFARGAAPRDVPWSHRRSIARKWVGFVPNNGAIRYSLAAFKNVGARRSTTSAPSGRGAFKGSRRSDFARRINPRLVNTRALEMLAAAGAFDELGVDRATAHANVDLVVAAGNRALETRAEGQEDLFPVPVTPRRPSSFA